MKFQLPKLDRFQILLGLVIFSRACFLPTDARAQLGVFTLDANGVFPSPTSIPGMPLAVSGFGERLDLDRNFMVIGAPVLNGQGEAYLYDLTKINDPNCLPDDCFVTLSSPATDQNDAEFGYSVAIDENHVVVGARNFSIGGVNGLGRVFLYDALAPAQPPVIFDAPAFNEPPGLIGDEFGHFVDIDGDWLLVGAPFSNRGAPGVDFHGVAYAFDVNDPTTPIELTKTNPAAGDFFGSYVALDGTIAVVGAPGHDSATTNDVGQVTLFDLSQTPPTRIVIDAPSEVGANGQFGVVVDIQGNRAVIGSIGGAFVYDLSDLNAITLERAFESSLPGFGESVAIAGDFVAIGARNATPREVFVYDLNELPPGTPQQINDPTPIPGSDFADFIAMDGSRLLIGTASSGANSQDAGSAALFRRLMLGDVNRDGDVDLLDVAPFVLLLNTGQFQEEADIDRDGDVTLLDVAPFVGLLSN